MNTAETKEEFEQILKDIARLVNALKTPIKRQKKGA